MIGFVLVATGGERYTKFLMPLIESIKKFMPYNTINVLTDSDGAWNSTQGVNTIAYENLGWPRATLMRYHGINSISNFLSLYSHVFYMDIDMKVEKKIEQATICGNGLTAVLHPGFPESFERNPKSAAFLPASVVAPYYQGCFIGGRTDSFLNMSRSLAEAIDKDDQSGIMALWHDESHLNRYLHQNRPAITLSPGYAFPALHYLKHPETWCPEAPENYQPFIRHLEKVDQGKWKNK